MDLRFTFNEDVINYDRMRPTYGQKIFDDIINYSELNNLKSALEVGIGTGQATLPILKTGCKVTAVELGKNMAEYVKQKFLEFGNFEVFNLDFERFSAEDDTYDIIYSATAFHWIPEEIGFTKAYRLLKPNGTIALFWNHPFVNRQDEALHNEIRRIYEKYRPNGQAPVEFDESMCSKYADILNEYGFKNIETRIYRQTRGLSADEYISLLNTYSDHRTLDIDIKNGLENEIKKAINKLGGELVIYDTIDLYLARKPSI